MLQALVKRHDDVATQIHLNLHRRFRRQEMLVAIDVRTKLDALFGELAKAREREDLEASAVCQNWMIPIHEFMKSTEFLDELFTRSNM